MALSSSGNPFQPTTCQEEFNAGSREPAVSKRVLVYGMAMAPGGIMGFLFYSLVIHMYLSLGKWPESIGNRGFPTALDVHANVAMASFAILLLLSVFLWPIVTFLCALVPRWHKMLIPLGIYAASCIVCFMAMLLAPSQFLYWWWD